MAAEVPYYRQILPTFALYIGKNKNLGHLMDYAQRKRLNLGELIHETLEILEAHGGHSCHQLSPSVTKVKDFRHVQTMKCVKNDPKGG